MHRGVYLHILNILEAEGGEKRRFGLADTSEYPSIHIRDKLLKKLSLNVRVKNYKPHVIICLRLLKHKVVKMYYHLKSIFI